MTILSSGAGPLQPGHTGYYAGGYGSHVLQALRIACNIPVICLTARDSVDDRVRGLELGTDDYLVKPFSFSELLARVKNQRRRHQPYSTSLRVADLVMVSARLQVTRGGIPVALTRKEFMLRWLLASRHGEILPRTLLASETNIVDVAIRRLRRKVDDLFAKKLITTVRGKGYCLTEQKPGGVSPFPHSAALFQSRGQYPPGYSQHPVTA